MVDSYYISRLAFEILIRTQTDGEVFLPSDGATEKANDNELIFAVNEMIKSGIYVAEDDGFSVSEDVAEFVICVLDAERVISTVGCESEVPVFYYLSEKKAACVELAQNRDDTYRISMVDIEDFAVHIKENMCLPDIEEVNDFNDYESEEEPEENIVFELETPADDLLENMSVDGIVDVINVEDEKILSRLVIHRKVLSIQLTLVEMSGKTNLLPYTNQEFYNCLQRMEAEK